MEGRLKCAFLIKIIPIKNYKSLNSKLLYGSISTIEFEILVKIFPFRFFRYSISQFSEALCVLNLTIDFFTDMS